MKPELLRLSLGSLTVFRPLTGEAPMHAALRLLDALSRGDGPAALESYSALFFALRQAGADSLGGWLEERLKYTETPYSLLAERGGTDDALTAAAERDIAVLTRLAMLDCGEVLSALERLLGAEYAPVLEGLPRWTCGAPFTFRDLTRFYQTNGAGLFAKYRAFLWQDGALIPVADPDCGGEDEMFGYDLQREAVIANTRALAAGQAVNNVLLFGDSGTGKSATVKHLLRVPGLERLRLIEIDKDSLAGLPALIRTLAGRPQCFVLFLDDLAFDRDDKTYSALKTILEGGVEKRPANVAVYATSNRRRLVRQTVSERDGDELDARETVDEKSALAQRFGLRLAYLPLNKADYLALVDRLACREGVALDRETLHREAVKWEAGHPGRTPRTAVQFIAGLRV